MMGLGEGSVGSFCVCSQAPLFFSNDIQPSAASNLLTYKRLVLYVLILQ